jgi:hypothetical protein
MGQAHRERTRCVVATADVEREVRAFEESLRRTWSPIRRCRAVAGTVALPLVGTVALPLVGTVALPLVGTVALPLVGTVALPLVGDRRTAPAALAWT